MKEDNPFNRFDSKPSSDSKNPFDQFDAPSDVSQAAPAAPKERGTYEKTNFISFGVNRVSNIYWLRPCAITFQFTHVNIKASHAR